MVNFFEKYGNKEEINTISRNNLQIITNLSFIFITIFSSFSTNPHCTVSPPVLPSPTRCQVAAVIFGKDRFYREMPSAISPIFRLPPIPLPAL